MKKLVNYDYVDMTDADMAARDELSKRSIAMREAKIEAEEKVTADKASGNQKLKDLGLTDDEIAALIG